MAAASGPFPLKKSPILAAFLRGRLAPSARPTCTISSHHHEVC